MKIRTAVKANGMPEFFAEPGGLLLPYPFRIRFSWQDFQDSEESYSCWAKAESSCVSVRKAGFQRNGVCFQCTQEWFEAPAVPGLLVFRQTLEASEDCVYCLNTSLDPEEAEPYWDGYEVPDSRNGFCEIALKRGQDTGILMCETTQIAASSVRVQEERKGCARIYQITAWKEIPVKLEKYVSVRCSGEDAWFPESALAECRLASRIRFDALRDGAAVTVTEEEIEKLRRKL